MRKIKNKNCHTFPDHLDVQPIPSTISIKIAIFSGFNILLHIVHTHLYKLEVNLNFQLVSERAHSVERIYFLSVILISL
jgi:hypothetical protein